MEEDPLLELARLEALSSDLPPLKPSGAVRRPEGSKQFNAGDKSAPAARGPTFRPTPGMIPVSQSDLQNTPAAAPAAYSDQRPVRPLPPPVSHRNKNTLFPPGAANANANSKYGSGAAMALPSTSRWYKDLGQGSLIKKFSGLNVKNPLVSSSQLEARLDAQSVVKLSDVVNRNHSVGLPKAWATLAAVGEVSVRKEDAHGKPFSIWKLTDLNDSMITLFLFGNAYHDHHKDGRPGAVVALFSPKVRSEGGQFSLSISRGDDMLELGSASEFGFCKSKTKNGQPCRTPVNTRICQYCSIHVQKEYNQLQSKRHELQGNSLKSAFQPGMKHKLVWNPGKFQPLNAVARPKLPAMTAAQLKEAAIVAAGRGGTSSGVRYISTVADPEGARNAAQEIETSRLRNNTLDPKAAPIPLARAPKIVMQNPLPANRFKKRGGGGVRVTPATAAAESKRPRTEDKAAKKDNDDDHDHEMIELEDDDIFFEEMQPPQPPAPQLQRATVTVVGSGLGRVGGTGSTSESDGPRGVPVRATQAPLTSTKPPVVVDGAKQRAIERLKSKISNTNTVGTTLHLPSNTPGFLRDALLQQQEERAEREQLQDQEQEEEREIELDEEQDGNDFTIAAKHNGLTGGGTHIASTSQHRHGGGAAVNDGSNSGRILKSSNTTVAGTKFFGAPGSTNRRPPPTTTTKPTSGIIPGLGKASTKPANSTKPGKSFLPNTATTNIRGKGRSTGGGGPPAATGFAAAFGSVIAEMEREEVTNPVGNNHFKGGSLYQDIVEQQDTEQLFNLMGVLEKKDNLAAKMDSIKTLNVAAWKCAVCSSITEYRPKACGESHPHALSKLQAIKRWWQCGGCKGRFHTVGVRYPMSRCPKCDVLGTDFSQVSMLKPQKKLEHEAQQGKVAGRELLVARGAEQKWVNQ
ncbi:hypothetical protein Ndes2526B_g04527 [Nannochloris sp. 'desiccata']|nr:hypothetical protein KSW81_000734 [Chlorella desiccata (nom. nud.)]KAH7620606.1 putative Protein MCM10-like protein [Chlorella desiccata (nom. nud.)]